MYSSLHFNEDSVALLQIMESMGISCGPYTHAYVAKENDKRINITKRRAQENTREARMRRRQEQISVLEAFSTAEEAFYRPEIDDLF